MPDTAPESQPALLTEQSSNTDAAPPPTPIDAVAVAAQVAVASAADGPAERREVADSFEGIRVGVLVIAVVLAIAGLKLGSAFLIPVVAGIFLSYALSPAVNWLALHVPRAVAAAAVVLNVTLCAAGVGYVVWGQAVKLVEQMPEVIPVLRSEFAHYLGGSKSIVAKVEEAAQSVSGAIDATAPAAAKANTRRDAAKAAPASPAVSTTSLLVTGGMTATAMVGTLLSSLLLALFLLAAGDQFRRKAIDIFGGGRRGRRVTEKALEEIHKSVQSYLGTLVITNVVLGVATWLCLLAFGLEDAGIWGVLAGLFHVIPYVGPLITAVGVFFSSLLQTGALGTAAATSAATVALAFAVGMVLQTWVMGKQAAINAPAMFIGVLLFGWAWGGIGLLLAVPLLVVVRVVADRIEGARPLARLLTDD